MQEIKRKCSMCGECHPESMFRWNENQKEFTYYCKNCQRLYIKEYMRIYRERKRVNKN